MTKKHTHTQINAYIRSLFLFYTHVKLQKIILFLHLLLYIFYFDNGEYKVV